YPEVEVGFHVHNLAGNGMANIVAALDAGASFIEVSICGIGGGIMTPTTIVSIGNLSSEDIVKLLNELGCTTGVSTDASIAYSRGRYSFYSFSHFSVRRPFLPPAQATARSSNPSQGPHGPPSRRAATAATAIRTSHPRW